MVSVDLPVPVAPPISTMMGLSEWRTQPVSW